MHSLPFLHFFGHLNHILHCSAAQLVDYHKKAVIPLNYMILEVIFSQLLRLPDPPIKPLFYGSLMLELCKSKNMPQASKNFSLNFYVLFRWINRSVPFSLEFVLPALKPLLRLLFEALSSNNWHVFKRYVFDYLYNALAGFCAMFAVSNRIPDVCYFLKFIGIML